MYAPDLPGYGASDKPRMRYTLRFYTDLVAPLLATLGLERASLVGISMGGAIGLGFALDHPERVERLVLVDSHGLGGHIPYGALGYLLVHLPWLNELSWKWLARDRAMVRKSLEQFVAGAGAITDDMVDEVFQMVKEPGVGAAWRSLQKSEVCWLHARTNYVSRLGEVRAPTLIIHGAGDKLVPLAWAERAQRLIPNAQLAVLPATRHWPPREQPDAFNRLLIDFLLVRGVPNKFRTPPVIKPDLLIAPEPGP